MKPLTLTLGLTLAGLGLLGTACSAAPDDGGAPVEATTRRIASSLERKLTAPIAVPTDTAIGGSIEGLIEARKAIVPRDPILNLGANGKRCTISRFDDDKGVEQMRRTRCDGATDTLVIGALAYTDSNSDGKIDHVADDSAATYELFDDDHDGKLDRVVESAEHVATPISLADFAENVTILSGGKIASRERADKDHDGKFDLESVTATTSFQILTTAAGPAPAP